MYEATTYVPGTWTPHREATTYVSGSWRRFIAECGLACTPDSRVYGDGSQASGIEIRGQDGWAFCVAIHFFTAAELLITDGKAFYASTDYLLSLIVERTRRDLTMLEAVEAIVLAFPSVHDDASASNMLKLIGIWPTPSCDIEPA